MPSLSTTLVHYLVLQISTSPVLRTYKESQEMPLQEQQIPPPHPPNSDLGNWRKHLLQKQDPATCLPLLG